MVELRKANNSKIILRSEEGVKSKSFFTVLKKEDILSFIKKNTSQKGNKIVILNVVKDNNKSEPIHIQTNKSLKDIRQDIFNHLENARIARDRYGNVKKLMIVNLITKKHESRTVSFHSKKSVEELYCFFDKIVERVIAKEDTKEIFFVDEQTNKKTHRWGIVDEKGHVKSKHIKIDGLSCEDLMRKIIDEFQGEIKC